MTRFAVSAVTAALLLAAALAARESSTRNKEGAAKKEGAHHVEGTWTREAGDAKIVFHIKKHDLRVQLTKGDHKAAADADYAVTKDGVLFGRVSKVEKGDGDNGPAEGNLFSFRFVVKDGTLTISDLHSPGGDEARQILEGEYHGAAHKKRGSKSAEPK